MRKRSLRITKKKESSKEMIGLWRFGIIFPLLKDNLQKGEKGALIKEILNKSYTIPGTNRTTISRATLYEWLSAYQTTGKLESLYPKTRIDRGLSRLMDGDTQEAIIAYRKREENRHIPLTSFIEKAQENGIVSQTEKISMDAVYRLFDKADLSFSHEAREDRRRFECEYPNEMWQMDFMHALRVKTSKNGREVIKKAKIAVLIDDNSRLAMAKAYIDETSDSLMDLMWDSFRARGLPSVIYTDNGSSMISQRIKLGCASLGVLLKFAKPYSPKSKAKVERFNKTLRDKLLCKISDNTLTLIQLNSKLTDFLYDYNNRTVHSAIGDTPIHKFTSGLLGIREAPLHMPELFRYREIRKVSEARTIKLDGVYFEVPIGYSKKKLELRFFNRQGDIEAFYHEKSIGFIQPVNFQKNSDAHRKQQTKENNA